MVFWKLRDSTFMVFPSAGGLNARFESFEGRFECILFPSQFLLSSALFLSCPVNLFLLKLKIVVSTRFSRIEGLNIYLHAQRSISGSHRRRVQKLLDMA